MTERRKGHRWQPIADLPEDLREKRFPELDGLLGVFQKRRQDLGAAKAIDAYTQRLVRSWSIETGILENLYTLGEGVTLTLVEHGFDAALISHGDTDLPTGRLIEILKDHQDAAEGLFAFVKGQRALGTSYVKELHQVLTRHQATSDAVDSQGNFVQVPLRRGEWKLLPNNPGDLGGGVARHQYCPPEQTGSEMDQLVGFHARHGDVHPVVEAAWLHHRFTQIHPFQDGNGRVARALASLVCIRGGGFPVVVTRHQKAEYICALEAADEGPLSPLIAMFEKQQRDALLRGIELARHTLEAPTIDEIITGAKERVLARGAVEGRMTELVGALAEIVLASYRAIAASVSSALSGHVEAFAMKSPTHAMALGSPLASYLRPGTGQGRALDAVALTLRGPSVVQIVIVFTAIGEPADELGVADLLVTGLGRNAAEWSGEPISFTPLRDRPHLIESFKTWLDDVTNRALSSWRGSL